jgi:hypothetical protein
MFSTQKKLQRYANAVRFPRGLTERQDTTTLMLILVREIHSHMFLSHHSEHAKGNAHLFSQGGGKKQ